MGQILHPHLRSQILSGPYKKKCRLRGQNQSLNYWCRNYCAQRLGQCHPTDCWRESKKINKPLWTLLQRRQCARSKAPTQLAELAQGSWHVYEEKASAWSDPPLPWSGKEVAKVARRNEGTAIQALGRVARR